MNCCVSVCKDSYRKATWLYCSLKVMVLLLSSSVVTLPPRTVPRKASDTSLLQVPNSHLSVTLTPVPMTSPITLFSNLLDLSIGFPINIEFQHVESWFPICYHPQSPQCHPIAELLFHLLSFFYPNPIKHDFILLQWYHKYSLHTLSLQPWPITFCQIDFSQFRANRVLNTQNVPSPPNTKIFNI